jgi:equilibrative nucleoside transporter 1/2/3
MLSSNPDVLLLINADAIFFLLLAFGMSHGYIGILCLMAAPSLEHNLGLRGKEDVDAAAMITVFCLVGAHGREYEQLWDQGVGLQV